MTVIPQSTGKSGWIVLTYDNAIPVCLWMTAQECRKLPCIIDERLCGDTFLRVEKIGPLEFLVADIWMFNSNCVFACSTFEQRHSWLKELLSTFTRHIDGTVHLIHKSNYSFPAIAGYEHHTNETIGKQGFFVEKDDSQIVHATQMNMPDCYEVNGGYLKVPDLRTSVYLRLKGKEFDCRCIANDDNSWSLVENIPDLE